MKNALLYDGLEYWRGQTSDQIALVLDNADTITYEALGRWSDGAAVELQALGVRAGETVAVAGANSIEWVVWAFAVLKVGAILVPFNERFVSGEFAHLVDTSEPVVIIADGPRHDILAPIAGKAKMVKLEGVDQYKAGAPKGWKPVRVPSTSVAMIIFTSGTTGQPKGAMYGHEEHLSNYVELGLTLTTLGPHTVQLMPVSLQSGVGTGWGYLFTTTVGGTMCYMRKFDAALALRMMVDRKVTFSPCFPVILEQISRLPEFAEADLSAISMASAGGARVSAGLLKRWRDKGVLLRQMYGQTEVGGYAIIGSAKEAEEGRLSCGKPMIFTKIRVVDADGNDCPPNQPGQILVNGPGNMLGYWKNPEATAKTVIDGWVHTGDLGVLDDEGYLTFVDRMKDMIITGGFNVSPSEVEAVIGQVPGVLEVAVIAVPDEKFGETPAALFYAEPKVDPMVIFAHCREKLAGFKLPRYVIPFDEPLPRMSSGKIAKRQLVAEYADTPTRFAKVG